MLLFSAASNYDAQFVPKTHSNHHPSHQVVYLHDLVEYDNGCNPVDNSYDIAISLDIVQASATAHCAPGLMIQGMMDVAIFW